MKIIPVEQITSMPMLLILELLTAIVVLTVGLLIVTKVLNLQTKKQLIVASGLVGVIAGLAMAGVLFGVNNHVTATNDTNLRAAVGESGQTLDEEQIERLKLDGAVSLGEDKIMSFLDEGVGYSLTVFDASDNEQVQNEEDAEREKQIKENDF